MLLLRFSILVILVTVIGLLVSTVGAGAENGASRTLSPYFFVKSDDPESDRLPLKSTEVRVNITGVIAAVTVKQIYRNAGKKPLEAVYIFPASTRAAVHAMKMTIGRRTIEAKIRKRDEARRAYEQAKQAGQSASLLEQHRPNVFQMNVANILPGDTIKVDLQYTELLVPVDKEYEFVYPTVVGPRYIGQEGVDTGSADWAENSYLQEGEPSPNTFAISVRLEAGMPIHKIASPSHKIHVQYQNKTAANVKLAASESNSADRDFILRYRLAGDRIASGLILYQGKNENYFLLMVQPPEHFKIEEIPPREYMFVVDISGSMHGFPLDIAKKLLQDLVGSLGPSDRFNVLLFAGGSATLATQSVPATKQNINQAINVIKRRRGSGSTRLLPALKRALAMGGTEGYSRTIVMITDGYVAVEEDVLELIRTDLGAANMFTFGIGSSVNRHIIEGMARAGFGEPFVITRPQEAAAKAAKFRQLIESPVLTNIEIDYGKFAVYDVEPPAVPDVMAQRPVIIFGKYHGRPQGTIKLRGRTGSGLFIKDISVDAGRPAADNIALRYLWARRRIASLGDFNRLRRNDDRIARITDLGLSYNLLTAYTSFVAIDSKVRLKNGQPIIVKQPLPLPRGVSNYALGGRSAVAGVPLMKSLAAPAPGAEMVIKGGASVTLKEAERQLPAAKDEDKPVQGDAVTFRIISMRMENNGLASTVVKKIITEKAATISRCYMDMAATGKSIASAAAEITLILEIAADGKLDSLRFVDKTQRKTILTACFKKAFVGFYFPKPQTGKEEKITVVLSWQLNQ